jgi:hypothetical protein
MKHRQNNKRGRKLTGYTYTGVVNGHGSTVAFPPGTRIKGERLSFAGDRERLRTGQLVVVRNPSAPNPGLCFFCQAIQPKVIAVVRLAILPTLPIAERAEVTRCKGGRYR